MDLVLCLAKTSGDKTNCLYPTRVEVSSAEDMAKALAFDHVCAEYDKNYRSISNFQCSNVVVMDCDNDHSEDPADWITPEKLDELMPDIAYVVAPSRHNMLPKMGRRQDPAFMFTSILKKQRMWTIMRHSKMPSIRHFRFLMEMHGMQADLSLVQMWKQMMSSGTMAG